MTVPLGDTHDLWINPHNPRLMVLADDGGSVVSLTGGKSWSSMNLLPTAEMYDVAVDHAFPYRVYTAQQDNTSISVPSWLESNTLHPMNAWMNAGGCETGPIALHPDNPTLNHMAPVLGISPQAVNYRLSGGSVQAIRRALTGWEDALEAFEQTGNW